MGINKVLFIGSKQLGLNCLKTIFDLSPEHIVGVLTLDDHIDPRSKLDDFKVFCYDNKIDLFIAQNKQDSDDFIIKIQPELCIVICWYWLFSAKILHLVPFGYIGLHNSILPKYRGGSPLVWSIINNDRDVGFSFFSFTEAMDDGDIWFQYKYRPIITDSISEILYHLELKSIEYLRTYYMKILNSEIQPKCQNHENATYCAQRIPTDGLINWNNSALSIHNFIRAQSYPYPGAFTYLKENKIIIWKAELDNRVYYGTPGQVALINSDGVYVICGDNKCILLKEISANEVKVSPRELIKSINTRLS